jgi:hypothetical protein
VLQRVPPRGVHPVCTNNPACSLHRRVIYVSRGLASRKDPLYRHPCAHVLDRCGGYPIRTEYLGARLLTVIADDGIVWTMIRLLGFHNSSTTFGLLSVSVLGFQGEMTVFHGSVIGNSHPLWGDWRGNAQAAGSIFACHQKMVWVAVVFSHQGCKEKERSPQERKQVLSWCRRCQCTCLMSTGRHQSRSPFRSLLSFHLQGPDFFVSSQALYIFVFFCSE